MIYLYAAVFTLAVTAVVVLVPLWVRGGGPAIRAESGWLAPLAVAIVASMALIAIAAEGGLGGSVTLLMGALSGGLSVVLIVQRRKGRPQSDWYQAVMAGALIVSIAVVVISWNTLAAR